MNKYKGVTKIEFRQITIMTFEHMINAWSRLWTQYNIWLFPLYIIDMSNVSTERCEFHNWYNIFK